MTQHILYFSLISDHAVSTEISPFVNAVPKLVQNIRPDKESS